MPNTELGRLGALELHCAANYLFNQVDELSRYGYHYSVTEAEFSKLTAAYKVLTSVGQKARLEVVKREREWQDSDQRDCRQCGNLRCQCCKRCFDKEECTCFTPGFRRG